VDNFAETAMPLVLPAIEKGLFDDAWRIRASSVHLLGDVMSKITGRNWKINITSAVDQDEGTGVCVCVCQCVHVFVDAIVSVV